MKIIGIAGGSGSGKTTFAKELAAFLLKTIPVATLQQDSYYLDRSGIVEEERAYLNFDHPDSIDADLLTRHLTDLKLGKPITVPSYDFSTHTRTRHGTLIQPTPITLVDGILIFALPQLQNLFDYKLFIDTPDDIRFIRRLQRDVKERGRSMDSIISQYLLTVRPMHNAYVVPSKQHADVTISGLELFSTPIAKTAATILALLSNET